MLSVQDSGKPIADDIARKLFSAPLPSREGMGIGLYQLATGAAEKGYNLSVSANEDGLVRFTLSSS